MYWRGGVYIYRGGKGNGGTRGGTSARLSTIKVKNVLGVNDSFLAVISIK